MCRFGLWIKILQNYLIPAVGWKSVRGETFSGKARVNCICNILPTVLPQLPWSISTGCAPGRSLSEGLGDHGTQICSLGELPPSCLFVPGAWLLTRISIIAVHHVSRRSWIYENDLIKVGLYKFPLLTFERKFPFRIITIIIKARRCNKQFS